VNNDECSQGSVETCRLFPLPGLVFFPHAVLPLHIFEPRYRQMTEDALSTDSLITMVRMRPDLANFIRAEPSPIESVGCLGKIIRYERLSDGRFNLLLVGLKRIRICAELPTGKPYRIASAEVVDDVPPERPESHAEQRLIERFRRGLAAKQGIDPDLQKLLDSGAIELGALTDVIAYTLKVPSRLKQELLAESDVDRRVELLLRILGEPGRALRSSWSRSFPPPFSRN
jgi:Lon protease-like protein